MQSGFVVNTGRAIDEWQRIRAGKARQQRGDPSPVGKEATLECGLQRVATSVNLLGEISMFPRVLVS